MASLDSLSDQEIRSRLTALGCEVGPVTPTTRKVYLKKLKTALDENNQSIDSHDARSPQRPARLLQDDDVLQNRKATPRQKSPVTKRKSPSRKTDVLPPLANSTFVDTPTKPHTSRSDVPRSTRIVPDTSRKSHINFDIVPSNDEPSVPKVQNDYYSYSKGNYTSENVPASRLKYSSHLSKDFDSSQPYTSDFTRHLSNLSASRVAATSMINQRLNVNSKLCDNVKESDDEDEGSEPTYTKFGSKGSSVRRNGSIYNFQRESWFGKDSSVIILIVLGLFFLIIGYTYISIHHSSETSVSSKVSELTYPKCDGYQPQGSCIPEHELQPVTVVFRLVHKELGEMAKNKGCSPVDTPFLYNMDIVKLVTDNEKSMSVWDVEKYVAHVKLLIKSNPEWNMIQTPEGVRLRQIPGTMYCTMVSYLLVFMSWALQLALVLVGGGLVYWGGRWWMERQARRKDEVHKLVGAILEVVSNSAPQDGCVVISHVRDMLIPPGVAAMRSLVVALFCLAAAFAGDVYTNCDPGTVWEKDCQRCECTASRTPSCNPVPGCQPQPPFQRPKNCQKGQQWKEDCNTCTCHDKGTVSCTRKLCPSHPHYEIQFPTKDASGGRRRRNPGPPPGEGGLLSQKTCIEGETWKDSCNTCVCSNGLPACTLMGCLEHLPPPPSNLDKMNDCKDGETWKIDCNSCFCANGKGACTQMGCLTEPITRFKREETCVDGENKKIDCNSCICRKGVWACTRMTCPKFPIGTTTKKDNNKDDKECTPLTAWKEDSNVCTCSAEGIKSCEPFKESRSRRDVHRECKVGETWMDDCNTCTCNKEGKASCSRMLCPSDTHFELPMEEIQQITSARRNRSPVSPPFECKPGETFMDDCNTCICSANGPPACTYQLCPSHQTTQTNYNQNS